MMEQGTKTSQVSKKINSKNKKKQKNGSIFNHKNQTDFILISTFNLKNWNL